MNNIRTEATVYISFVGMERNKDQSLKNEELNKWVEDNVDILNRNFVRFSRFRNPHLVGIYLEPEQAIIYKLMFSDV